MNIVRENFGEGISTVTPGVGRQFVISNLYLPSAELITEVTHRGKEVGDPQFVAPDVRILLSNFGHPDNILRLIKAVECGRTHNRCRSSKLYRLRLVF